MKQNNHAATEPRRPAPTSSQQDDYATSLLPLGRMMAVIMAVVGLMIILGATTLAPRWAAYQKQEAQSAAISQIRPAAVGRPLSLRSDTLKGRPRPSLQHAPSLQMQGSNLTPNVPLQFAGAGFLPGETLKVTIQNATGQQQAQLATLKADAAGKISAATEAVPAGLAPGSHELVVAGMSSHRQAQASFQMGWIQPTVQMDAYSAEPGYTVNFAGSGFLPGEIVQARLISGRTAMHAVATVSASAGGNVNGRFTAPMLPEGDYSLSFTGNQSQTPIRVNFHIRGFHPWVVLDNYAPSLHTHIGFEGKNFAPGEEVQMYLNARAGQPIAHFIADATGRFVAQAAWEVPSLSGENTLIFVGQQSGAVTTTTFTEMP